jgi:hypothetical protein
MKIHQLTCKPFIGTGNGVNDIRERTDEVAVIEQARNKGICKLLFDTLIEDTRKKI